MRSAAEHETPAKNGHKNKSAEGTTEFLSPRRGVDLFALPSRGFVLRTPPPACNLPPLRGLRGDKHSTHLCLLQYLLTFFDIVSKTMNLIYRDKRGGICAGASMPPFF